MLKLFEKFSSFVLFVFLFFFQPTVAIASQPHYTLIINQVRGTSCCDVGNIKFFEDQIETVEKHRLSSVFAVRFDTLTDPDFSKLLKRAALNNEMAAFLEITPDLASASGVTYQGTKEDWYAPNHLYLIGYSQEDRLKIIDTYMKTFKNFFGFFPTTSVSWMIDTYSLQYLHDAYNTRVHEITREQWNTDAISLIGGPPHYPYFPSRNWALVPDIDQKMPLIVRQTITDPVKNYGDSKNSHTSQPNDYMPRNPDFGYFEHLFNQAHNQPLNPYTFALIGLENSMDQIYQNAFIRQLEYVANWQKNNPDNQVLNARDFFLKSRGNIQPFVYAGENAWWVTTNTYRVRIRQIDDKLFISDIRVYNPTFRDPYFERRASSRAYWIVPFLLDGSKFFNQNETFDFILSPKADSLSSSKILIPKTFITSPKLVENKIVLADKLVFENDWFEIPSDSIFDLNNPLLSKIVKHNGNHLEWPNLIGLKSQTINNSLRLTPFSDSTAIETEREVNFPYLSPHLSSKPIDFKKSILYSNNLYAIFARNPVRLIFFPKDDSGYPAKIIDQLVVTTSPEVSNITIGKPDEMSGAVFIDIFANAPGKTKVIIKVGDEVFNRTIYSTVNCKTNFSQCLRNPEFLWWWYLFHQTN